METVAKSRITVGFVSAKLYFFDGFLFFYTCAWFKISSALVKGSVKTFTVVDHGVMPMEMRSVVKIKNKFWCELCNIILIIH